MMLFESQAASMIKDLLGAQDRQQLGSLLAYARTWWDDDPAEYQEEIARRIDYLDDEMEDDLDDILKDEFPRTYKLMSRKKVMLPIMRHINNKRFQAFAGEGLRAYLVDASGQEVPADHKAARALAHMVEAGDFFTACARGQTLRGVVHSCAIKPWYDDRAKCVQFSAFDPLNALLVVNPERSHDAYSAAAALFRRDGYEGIASDPVWEFWGARAEDVREQTDGDGMMMFWPTLHYLTSSKYGPRKVNEDDRNPFVDQWTGDALYPFSWWTSRRNTIYRKGGDALTKFNRLANLGLTWLHSNMEWQMSSIPVIGASQGVNPNELAKFKARYINHPKFMMELPPGCTLEFKSPQKDLKPFASIYEMLIQYHALMNDLSPKMVSISDGVPQSGIALQIELDNLLKHNAKEQKELKGLTEHALRVGINVQNYYASSIGISRIPPNMWPAVEFGHMSAGPKDREAIDSHYSTAIVAGVATSDDWLAELHDIPKEEAQRRIDENLKRQAEINAVSMPAVEEPTREDAERDLEDLPEREETETAPDSTSEEIARLEKVNVYQLKVAIEAGAATPVDMRMAVFGEDEATATRKVEAAMEFNRRIASQVGEIEAARQAPVVAAKEGEGAPSPEGGELPAPDEVEEPAPTGGAFDDM